MRNPYVGTAVALVLAWVAAVLPASAQTRGVMLGLYAGPTASWLTQHQPYATPQPTQVQPLPSAQALFSVGYALRPAVTVAIEAGYSQAGQTHTGPDGQTERHRLHRLLLRALAETTPWPNARVQPLARLGLQWGVLADGGWTQNGTEAAPPPPRALYVDAYRTASLEGVLGLGVRLPLPGRLQLNLWAEAAYALMDAEDPLRKPENAAAVHPLTLGLMAGVTLPLHQP